MSFFFCTSVVPAQRKALWRRLVNTYWLEVDWRWESNEPDSFPCTQESRSMQHPWQTLVKESLLTLPWDLPFLGMGMEVWVWKSGENCRKGSDKMGVWWAGGLGPGTKLQSSVLALGGKVALAMTMTQRRKNTEGLSMPLLVCLCEVGVGQAVFCSLSRTSQAATVYTDVSMIFHCVHRL